MDYFLVSYETKQTQKPIVGSIRKLRLVKAYDYEMALEHIKDQLRPNEEIVRHENLTILPEIYRGL